MGYNNDFECYDAALHPDPKKQNEIWINIGAEDGDMAQLTMGVGEPDSDGFYQSYTVFAMNTPKEVDQIISMLEEAKELVSAYREEFSLDDDTITD